MLGDDLSIEGEEGVALLLGLSDAHSREGPTVVGAPSIAEPGPSPLIDEVGTWTKFGTGFGILEKKESGTKDGGGRCGRSTSEGGVVVRRGEGEMEERRRAKQ